MTDFHELFLQEQMLLSAAELQGFTRRRSIECAVDGEKTRPAKGWKVFVEPMLRILQTAEIDRDTVAAASIDNKLAQAMGDVASFLDQQAEHWERHQGVDPQEAECQTKIVAAIEALDELEDIATDLHALLEARRETQSETSEVPQGQLEAANRPGEESGTSDVIGFRYSEATGEPFVSFVGMDRAGLVLSGGGIRSATFNLGLLQGLHRFDLLGVFDYLSTVSGGGYIGGWWSAWKHRIGEENRQDFPKVPEHQPAEEPEQKHPDGLNQQPPEPDEVRHLREFSNFLIPKLGFFTADMWYGVVAILSGLLPTLVIGASLIGLVWVSFLVAHHLMEPASHYLMVNQEPARWFGPVPLSMMSLAALTAGILFGFEFWWRRTCRIKNPSDMALAPAIWFAIAAIAVACMTEKLFVSPHFASLYCLLHRHFDLPTIHNSYTVLKVDLDPTRGDLGISPGMFYPAIAWLFAAVILLFARHIASWFSSPPVTSPILAAGSRVVGRLLGASGVWVVLACTWLIATQAKIEYAWLATGGAAAAAAEMFRRVRGWMTTQPTQAQTGSFIDLVKPLLPQILAYVGVFAAFVLVAGAIERIVAYSWHWWVLGGDIATLVLLARFLDPEALGLHRFYQERIARCYLGASNTSLCAVPHHPPQAPTARQNRQTDMDREDDCALSIFKTKDPLCRPLHLICCTANNLMGDQVGNLYRMARSAALSPFGLSIGNLATGMPDVKLSLAQTASAAAFNSQMGSLSYKLGPAVTFLMAMLNLRLGLWLRIPEDPSLDQQTSSPPGWRGWLLFREFWSGSVCPARIKPPKDVHLSDGGHFENLGLYELVRRHCRFIVVSDCGADPEYKFDDLGNALRRIRTDFGIEIEIDVTPLIPDEKTKKARQHIAVGTIFYNDDDDQGLLFLFKPNLRGEEPDDIEQYRQRNQAFPQESTGDQFYDEAQWESYRRLGQHAAHSAFRFLERIKSLPSRYSVFTEAFLQWTTLPADVSAGMLGQAASFRSLTTRLGPAGSPEMLEALLPELEHLEVKSPSSRTVLPVLLEATQMMEDVFFALRLYETGTNPEMAGWDNLFRRITQSKLFQNWWPVVEGLYSRPFREFLNDVYHLDRFSPGAPRAIRKLVRETNTMKKTKEWQLFNKRIEPELCDVTRRIKPELRDIKDRRLLMAFDIEQENYRLYLGELIYQSPKKKLVTWHVDHLFALPPYRGLNILAAYLEDIVKGETFEEGTQIEVDLTPPETKRRQTDEANRTFQANRIRIYMSLGFKLRKRGDRRFLVKEIRKRPASSTAFGNEGRRRR